jgi:hypothetical protein
MNKTTNEKIFKIITKIKACRAKTIENYDEFVSIDLAYGIHKNEARNAVNQYIQLFFSMGLKSKNNECVFTFKTMDELEKFLNENIEGYGVSNRTKSKIKT